MVPGRLEGMISPFIWVVRLAASTSMSLASITLKPAQASVAPISSFIASVICGPASRSACAAARSRRRRSPGGVADQTGKAAAAASAARVASSGVAAAALVARSPVIGLLRSKRLPFAAG
ncbi:hypothetical protein D3C71_1767910 [compost metagenome]